MTSSVARSATVAAIVALLAIAPIRPGLAADRDDRLASMRAEIERLQGEVRAIRGRERGVVGELDRIDAELLLRRSEQEEVTLRLELLSTERARLTDELEALRDDQERRREYLAFRLREIYKSGPHLALRALVGGTEAEDYWRGLRYASVLNERDAEVLAAFRDNSERLVSEQARLDRSLQQIDLANEENVEARRRLEEARASRAAALRALQRDASRRTAALGELREAASALGSLVESVQAGDAPLLDMRKFRGLLDWPADGRVVVGFGTRVHPVFKTRVPHPGLEIAGKFGDRIRAVFDGRVAFASWMRGYGLTVIVDHGGGLMSIYARASAVVVEPGQSVLRGERLGVIGDASAGEGEGLYFELRVDGKPTDPGPWMRKR